MEHDWKSFYQSQNSRKSNALSNSFCSFNLRLNNQHNIHKTPKEITGVITLVPKVPMLNIPIQVTIIGESQCTVFEEEISESSFFIQDSFEGPKSFRIHETEEELVERRNEAERCLQSTEFLSESYTENNKHLPQQLNKEIFLQGKQQLFQLKNQNNAQLPGKKIKVLKQNQSYAYEFGFFLPPNVPISVNSKIFPGVYLFVGYRIEVGFEMDEKFILCDEETKAKHLQSGSSIKVSESFEIKKVSQNTQKQSVVNRLTFKYFNSQGEIQDNQPSLTSCIMKCFCPHSWRQRYFYDLYHCELLTSIDQFHVLHLTARIFLQPNKDKIDVRKVKQGKLYMTNKKADPEERQQDKSKGKSSMTNSKIMPEKDVKSDVKIHQLKVTFYGEIVDIKKVTIFQKVISLNRDNYDALQGDLILQLLDTYFSQKNQLFQIRYWFQIQPVSDYSNDLSDKCPENNNQSPTKDGQFNEFDITMGKLTGNNRGENKKQQKVKENSSKEKKTHTGSNSQVFKIENVSEWHSFIRL